MKREPFPPFQGYDDAFAQIEGPISRIHRLAKLQRLLADTRGEDGTAEFKEEVSQGMVVLADEIFAAIDDLENMWLHFWNAASPSDRKGLAQ